MFSAETIPQLHQAATSHWHDATQPGPMVACSMDELILQQHRANFDLWHTEDRARIPSLSGDQMITIKHDIDRLNQQRNDLTEAVDLTLLELAPKPLADISLHSETPGLMIDRLSILALKIFHTEEESRRPGASPEHHGRNRQRLALLLEQRDDLARALAELWKQVLAGKRRFKLYRQMKMYNDPSLNPAVYNAGGD